MKYLMIIALSLLTTSQAFAAGKEISATVNGMVCGFCAQGITKKFSAEEAVEKVDVSLEKKVVTINLKEGRDLDDKKVQDLLKESGYNVEKIVRK
jgi:mercuric ion binding protein